MEIRLFKNWWLLTIKGVLAVGFGSYILLFQYSIITTLIAKIFGLILIASGILISIGAFLHKKSNPRWIWWLIEGIVDFSIGAIFIFKPQWAKAFILAIMAIWACLIGILQIITAFKMTIYMPNWWNLLIGGIFSILFAILIFINPFYGTFTIVTIAGVAAIIFGMMLVYMSRTLRDVYL